MRVLVIEDDFLHSTVLKQILSNLNFAVDVADDAAQAYDYFEREVYDAIFCDICLPNDNDGFEILSRFRRLDSRTTLVGMSGYGQEGVDYLCHRMGINQFLFKPFVEADIREALGIETVTLNPAKTSSRFDQKCLERLEKLLGSKAKLHELVSLFMQQMCKTDEQLHQRILFSEISQAKSSVHQLKSNAKLFGANELSNSLFKLEKAFTDYRHKQYIPLIKEVKNEYDKIEHRLINYFDDHLKSTSQ